MLKSTIKVCSTGNRRNKTTAIFQTAEKITGKLKTALLVSAQKPGTDEYPRIYIYKTLDTAWRRHLMAQTRNTNQCLLIKIPHQAIRRQ